MRSGIACCTTATVTLLPWQLAVFEVGVVSERCDWLPGRLIVDWLGLSFVFICLGLIVRMWSLVPFLSYSSTDSPKKFPLTKPHVDSFQPLQTGFKIMLQSSVFKPQSKTALFMSWSMKLPTVSATVPFGLLSWGHLICGNIVDLIAQILFELNWAGRWHHWINDELTLTGKLSVYYCLLYAIGIICFDTICIV